MVERISPSPLGLECEGEEGGKERGHHGVPALSLPCSSRQGEKKRKGERVRKPVSRRRILGTPEKRRRKGEGIHASGIGLCFLY